MVNAGTWLGQKRQSAADVVMHLTTGHLQLYVAKDEDISFDEIQTWSKLNNKEKDKPTLSNFKIT